MSVSGSTAVLASNLCFLHMLEIGELDAHQNNTWKGYVLFWCTVFCYYLITEDIHCITLYMYVLLYFYYRGYLLYCITEVIYCIVMCYVTIVLQRLCDSRVVLLYCIVLYCIELYCIVLYFIVLYCIIIIIIIINNIQMFSIV